MGGSYNRLTTKGKLNPNYTKLVKAVTFLSPYHYWQLHEFGPDELWAVRDAMIAHRYKNAAGKLKAMT